MPSDPPLNLKGSARRKSSVPRRICSSPKVIQEPPPLEEPETETETEAEPESESESKSESDLESEPEPEASSTLATPEEAASASSENVATGEDADNSLEPDQALFIHFLRCLHASVAKKI